MDRFTGAGLLGQLFPIDFGALRPDAMAYLIRRYSTPLKYSTVPYFALGKVGWKDCRLYYKKCGHSAKVPPSPSSLSTSPGDPGRLPELGSLIPLLRVG